MHHGDTEDTENFLARLPPSLLRSFGGLMLSPAVALAKAGRAQRFSSVLSVPPW